MKPFAQNVQWHNYLRIMNNKIKIIKRLTPTNFIPKHLFQNMEKKHILMMKNNFWNYKILKPFGLVNPLTNQEVKEQRLFNK